MNLLSIGLRNARRRMTLMGAIVLGGLPAGQAMSATDGALGATSTGTVSISASVPARARITGLSDVAFTNQDPGTPAANAQDVCVWSNTATKAYTITATGSGTASAFTLTDGSGTVPYSVEWSDTSGSTSGTALVAGTASAAQASAATNQICASGPAASASLVVKMATADLGTMTGGSNYTGTLTLLVTPQ